MEPSPLAAFGTAAQAARNAGAVVSGVAQDLLQFVGKGLELVVIVSGPGQIARVTFALTDPGVKARAFHVRALAVAALDAVQEKRGMDRRFHEQPRCL